MKKIIMMAIALSTLAVSSFANDLSDIKAKAVNTFNKSFRHAEDVRWEVRDNLVRVTFKNGGKEMHAYYNAEGEQVAVTRNIHIQQLPLTLANDLTIQFENSWLTELFEVSSEGTTAYYATIETATHITILKAEGISGWSTFKKDRKK